MADDVSGKVALITGATGGIGRALVAAFVARGMKVGICDVDAGATKALQDKVGAEQTLAAPADVSDAAACARAVDQVAQRFGGLHVLVNNAGLGLGLVRADHMERPVQIEDISVEMWHRFFAVNTAGAFHMCKAAVPRFRAQRWGRIINVTTSMFTMLRGGFSPYGPAKAALEAWSAGLSKELADTGITVNVVVPGGVTDTPMVPTASFPDRAALIRPDCMAPPMLHLISDAGATITGLRFVAAHWDPAVPPAEAIKRAGAPIGWPDLAQNPVWPGGRPKD
jgi:NAD(P)-dependent dehydrogenase (short-subunit alcohol dehydrogenase family)